MKKLFLITSLSVALLSISCKKTEKGPAGENGKDGVSSEVQTQIFTGVAITQTVGNGFYFVELPVTDLLLSETVIVTAQQSVSSYTANPGNANTDSWSSMPFYINGGYSSYLVYELKDGILRINVQGTVYPGDRFNIKIARFK